MKLFRSDQIKDIDKLTIAEEPIASIDLMERAAGQLLKWISAKFERSQKFFVFVGPGNNGGDGLALARLLDSNRYDVEVFYIDFTDNTSTDWKTNYKRLKDEKRVVINHLTSKDHFPVISSDDVIIDSIFGSGLRGQLTGVAGEVIEQINQTDASVLSVDIPSGLLGDDNTKNNYEAVVSADYTLSFQFHKLSFMFPENAPYIGECVILPIGLSKKAIAFTETPYRLVEKSDTLSLLKSRFRSDHKGTFGHGLLIAGSSGKTGAAILGAKAALRCGIGLITCHVPVGGASIIQCAVPEAMVQHDKNEKQISEIGKTDSYSAVAIGPGIGTGSESKRALYKLLSECKKPLVIDADGLNILSSEKEWFSLIPEKSVLTPHVKEFERLTGKADNGFLRLEKQIVFSRECKCIVILKGAYSSVTTPEGAVYFNSTGNPGMATAGSGDVLTGILLSLLAQGYTPENAAILGVYIHGLAGDIAAENLCYESVIASDIINCLSDAFKRIRED